MIELKQLRYFVAVAEELNFGRAAQRLRISQPPLSRQIQQLEGELGVQLFERNNRSVKLTVPGLTFFEETQKTLEQASHSFEMARRAQSGELGQLSLGVAPMLELSTYPRLEAQLKKYHPSLQIKRFVIPSSEQTALLRSGHLDAGLVRLPLEEQDFLTVSFWFREPLVVMMRHDNPLAARKMIRIAELSGQNRLSFRQQVNPGLFSYIANLCYQAAIRNSRLIQTRSFSELLNGVLEGEGVAILPVSFAQQQTTGVRYVRLGDRDADIQVGLLYRREHHPPNIRPLRHAIYRTQWRNWYGGKDIP